MAGHAPWLCDGFLIKKCAENGRPENGGPNFRRWKMKDQNMEEIIVP